MGSPEAVEVYRLSLVEEILNEIGTSSRAMRFYNKVFEVMNSSDGYRSAIYKTQDIPGRIQNLGMKTLKMIKDSALNAKGKALREIAEILSRKRNQIQGPSRVLSKAAELAGVSIKPNEQNSLSPKTFQAILKNKIPPSPNELYAILNDLNALSPKELFAILEELNKPINP